MAKKTVRAPRPELKTADLFPLTIRVDPEVARRVRAVLMVTGRTWRDFSEEAFGRYLGSLKLEPAKQRAVDALIAAGD